MTPASYGCGSRVGLIPRQSLAGVLGRLEAVVRYVMIAIGGALGSLARYQVASLVQMRVPAGFPWGTFVVNVSGCLVMGVVTTLLATKIVTNPQWRFLIPIGFIGAYTTFSTFEMEWFQANMEGAWLVGAAYAFGSLAAGYAALWAGVTLARVL
jgi:fluoride exporter